MDYYDTIICQRTASEAAALLADECRKKDAAIAQLQNIYRALGGASILTEGGPMSTLKILATQTEEDEVFLQISADLPKGFTRLGTLQMPLALYQDFIVALQTGGPLVKRGYGGRLSVLLEEKDFDQYQKPATEKEQP